MDESNQLIEAVLFNFQEIRNSGNEGISRATEWLQNFYKRKESIITLLSILQRNSEKIFRLHAAIGLKDSISLNWESLSIEEQDSIYHILLNILMSDNINDLRRTLIIIMTNIMHYSYIRLIPPTFSLIQQNIDNPAKIPCLLSISQIICIKEMASQECAQQLMIALLFQAYQISEISTHLLGFETMLLALRNQILPDITIFWEHLLELFEPCAAKIEYLTLLCSHFNTLIDEFSNLIDIDSLIQKLLPIFYLPTVDDNILLPIFSIIETLCEQFLDYFDELNIIPQILYISFHLLFKFFDPDEPNKTQFFESIMSSLVQVEDTGPFLSLLWQICTQVVGSDTGKYAAIVAIKAVFEENSKDVVDLISSCDSFFYDNIKTIIDLIMICLCSEIPIFPLTAASAILDFVPLFHQIYDPSVLMLIRQLIELIQQHPEPQFLQPFAALLGTLPSTTDIFDDVIKFLLELAHSSSVMLHADTLNSITALISGSPEKVVFYFEPLIQLVHQVLVITNEEYMYLKPSALLILKELLKMHYYKIVPENTSLFLYLSQTFHSQDSKYVIAALKMTQMLFETYPEIAIVWSTIDLSFLLEQASRDWSRRFSDACRNLMSEIATGDTIPYEDRFAISSLSLHILSRSCIMNPEICKAYSNQLLEFACSQTNSVTSSSIVSACSSIACLAQAMSSNGMMSQEIVDNIIKVLLSTIKSPVEDNSEHESNTAACKALKTILVDLGLRPQRMDSLFATVAPVVSQDGDLSAISLLTSIGERLQPAFSLEIANVVQKSTTYFGKSPHSPMHPVFAYFIFQILLNNPESFDQKVRQEILGFIIQRAKEIQESYIEVQHKTEDDDDNMSLSSISEVDYLSGGCSPRSPRQIPSYNANTTAMSLVSLEDDDQTEQMKIAQIEEPGIRYCSQFFSLCLLAKCMAEPPAPVAQKLFELLFLFANIGEVKENTIEMFLFQLYQPRGLISSLATNFCKLFIQEGQDFAQSLNEFAQFCSGNEQIVRLAIDLMLSSGFEYDSAILKEIFRNALSGDPEGKIVPTILGELFPHFAQIMS